jgi:hypothetical protein
MRDLSTALIVGGLALALLGVLARVGGLDWIGHLPGDIRIRRGHTRVYAPLATLLIISLAISLFDYALRRWF